MSTRAFNDFPSVKYDASGKMTVMARSGGYVMARRPRCTPFVKSEKEWLALSDAPAAFEVPMTGNVAQTA